MTSNIKKQDVPPLLKGHGIPDFKKITPLQINKHFPTLLNEVGSQFNKIEQSLDQSINSNKSLSWDELMTPLHKLGERLRWSWGVISHLNGVCNTAELREAYSTQQPEVIRLSNRISQQNNSSSIMRFKRKATTGVERSSEKDY